MLFCQATSLACIPCYFSVEKYVGLFTHVRISSPGQTNHQRGNLVYKMRRNHVTLKRKTGLTSVFESIKPSCCSMTVLTIKLCTLLACSLISRVDMIFTTFCGKDFYSHVSLKWLMYCTEETKLPSPCIPSPVHFHKSKSFGPPRCAAYWFKEIKTSFSPALSCTVLHRKGELWQWFFIVHKELYMGERY